MLSAIVRGRANTQMALAISVCCHAYTKKMSFPLFPWVGEIFSEAICTWSTFGPYTLPITECNVWKLRKR